MESLGGDDDLPGFNASMLTKCAHHRWCGPYDNEAAELVADLDPGR